MKKVNKGVVAAGAGVVLLLGGGGTLAVWTEEPGIPGGNINAGHMNLVPLGSGTGCGDWLLDTDEPAPPATYVEGDPLVPGDVLFRDCTFTIEAVGNHLRAEVGIGTPVFADADTTDTTKDDFHDMLSVGVSDVVIGPDTKATFTEEDHGETLSARITVTFSAAALNNTEDLQTVLQGTTLTATQVHADL